MCLKTANQGIQNIKHYLKIIVNSSYEIQLLEEIIQKNHCIDTINETTRKKITYFSFNISDNLAENSF